MSLPRPVLELFSDINFVQKRIAEQEAYIKSIGDKRSVRYKKNRKRVNELLNSAQERLDYFRKIESFLLTHNLIMEEYKKS